MFSKQFTSDMAAYSEMTQLSGAFKLRFFSDVNYLPLLVIYGQLYNRQPHLSHLSNIYRLLTNHAVTQTNYRFSGDINSLLINKVVENTTQNICSLLICIDNL